MSLATGACGSGGGDLPFQITSITEVAM